MQSSVISCNPNISRYSTYNLSQKNQDKTVNNLPYEHSNINFTGFNFLNNLKNFLTLQKTRQFTKSEIEEQQGLREILTKFSSLLRENPIERMEFINILKNCLNLKKEEIDSIVRLKNLPHENWKRINIGSKNPFLKMTKQQGQNLRDYKRERC